MIKKIQLFVIIVISFILLSCAFLEDQNDGIVRVENECPWQIYVQLLKPEETLETYWKINSDRYRTWENVIPGQYYIWISSPLDYDWGYFDIEIRGGATYKIDWDIGQGGYIIKRF